MTSDNNLKLQLEDGSYLRICNSIIDKLIELPLSGMEFQICLFIIRKTYGYNKTEDEISITQFEKATNKFEMIPFF